MGVKITAHEILPVKITGQAPLILHNGQLADPLNYWSKEIRKYSSKRKKTDEDHLKMYELEWHGSLYLQGNDNGQGPTRVCMPGECIEATVISGAKKVRKTANFKAGIIIDTVPIEYEGPQDIVGLWQDENFRLVRPVRIKQNTVIRCRPIFNKWSLTFDVHYLPDVLNREEVLDVLKIAGRVVGICDWRPKYGRFSVEDLTGKTKK